VRGEDSDCNSTRRGDGPGNEGVNVRLGAVCFIGHGYSVAASVWVTVFACSSAAWNNAKV